MTLLDLALVAAYLASVVAAGAWFSRRQKTTKQYFTGGGHVPWWAVAASIVATETSAISFISVPGAAYARGGNLAFLQLVLGYLLGRLVVSWLFIPSYFRGELLTVYQLLESRFGTGVKGALAALFVGMRCIADGVRLLLTATVLFAVWDAFFPGSDRATAVTICAAGLGAVMILFTLWGGMEAVIWIEVVQLAVYLAGALAAAAVLVTKIPGGFEGAVEIGSRFEKWTWLQTAWTLDRSAGHTLWAGLIGGCFLTMSTHGTDQYLVQRYLCVDGPRRATAALLASGAVVFLQFAMFLGIGVLLFAHFRPYELASYGTAAAAAPFARTDEVFPAFITRELPPGVGGLVVAAILAAALSSSLNSIAATTVNDLIRPLTGIRDDRHSLRLSKGITVAAGIVQIAVAAAMFHSQQSALDSALTVASIFNGPVLGVFLLGTWTKRPGALAAIGGIAVGTAVVFLVWLRPAWWRAAFGELDLFWPWYTAVGALTTLGAGTLLGRFQR